MSAESKFKQLRDVTKKWQDFVGGEEWETIKVFAIAAYTEQLQTTTLIDNNARIDGARAMLEVLTSLGEVRKDPKPLPMLKPPIEAR